MDHFILDSWITFAGLLALSSWNIHTGYSKNKNGNNLKDGYSDL